MSNITPTQVHVISRTFPFYEKITIHTSAVATFHAPSDLSGIGGMKRACIHAVNHWRNSPGHYDTMFINTTHNASFSSAHGFLDLEVAHAHLFLSFVHEGVKYPCVLVHWFSRPSDVSSDIMGMSLIAIVTANLLMLSFTWTQSLGLPIS